MSYFLGNNKKLDKLLKIIKKENFHCIIKSSYGVSDKQIYSAEMIWCKTLEKKGGIKMYQIKKGICKKPNLSKSEDLVGNK